MLVYLSSVKSGSSLEYTLSYSPFDLPKPSLLSCIGNGNFAKGKNDSDEICRNFRNSFSTVIQIPPPASSPKKKTTQKWMKSVSKMAEIDTEFLAKLRDENQTSDELLFTNTFINWLVQKKSLASPYGVLSNKLPYYREGSNILHFPAVDLPFNLAAELSERLFSNPQNFWPQAGIFFNS